MSLGFGLPAPSLRCPSGGAVGMAFTPETCARAKSIAATIQTDGADVAARLLLESVGRGRVPRARAGESSAAGCPP